ncbi:MAG: hypothetical protein K2X34_09970 [Hyphomonadaceae bacterium]|nr:hypothetical protein [Hyphomonadaceae bacterium]
MNAAPATTLQITLKRRIWRITLDGVFYGDYRTRRHADDSADAAADALRKQGRTVTIVVPPVGA